MSGSSNGTRRFDVVVVGARCAGSSAAIRLARGGLRVALVDADAFPSDTVSTHVVFPDSLGELEDLGVLPRLAARHRLAPVKFSWRVLGRDVAGSFTPIGGHDRCLSVRRITLDAMLVETARDAGADLYVPHRVVDVVGTGTPSDPARGVVLDDGRRLLAPWVLGADGQRSTVARRLRLPASKEQRGEMALLLGYWRGLPPSDWCILDIHESATLMSVPVEDGLHLLNVAGPPELTRGGRARHEARYEEALRTFPGVLNPRLLPRAERVSPVVAAPETMMRGYHRPAAGPGWALVGDAGHLKHPSTAQGIGDALQQARYVAEHLLAGGDLGGFEAWRDARSAGHDEWSFRAARFPEPKDGQLYAGIAADDAARQEFLDTFTKRTRMDGVVTAERSRRWHAATAYEDGLRRLVGIVGPLGPGQLERTVPACPAWTVRQLLAHVAGVAEDCSRGAFFAGALDAWHDEQATHQREQWTAGHVAARAGLPVDTVLEQLRRDGDAFVAALRSGRGPAVEVPAWMLTAPVGDLAVHLEDLAEAVGAEPDPAAPIWRAGFELYLRWLSTRLRSRCLPALRLTDGRSEWVAGDGIPAATVRAGRGELFRMVSGRRSGAWIRTLPWDGDPAPYVDVVSPYPLPADPVVEVAARP